MTSVINQHSSQVLYCYYGVKYSRKRLLQVIWLYTADVVWCCCKQCVH